MVKRKNFVSDGLVTLRHRHHDQPENENGSHDISPLYSKPDTDKSSTGQQNRTQVYQQTKNDFDIRLHEQLSMLETEIAAKKQCLVSCEGAYERLENVLKRFADLPEATDIEENLEAARELEQLRVEFFSIKAGCGRAMDNNPVNAAPPAPARQISLLPELNSLNQLQMLRMGLCFALPLIVGVIAGCGIIAWVIMITWGG